MSLPLLRETRMPAVICEIGPAAVVVEQAATLARAVVGLALGRVGRQRLGLRPPTPRPSTSSLTSASPAT